MTAEHDAKVAQARAYIETFARYTLPGTEYVETDTRRIEFKNMTDEDALFVASEFARMEAKAARRGRAKGRLVS